MVKAKESIALIDDDAFAEASMRGSQTLARGPQATAASYKAGGCVRVELNNDCAFEFPVVHAQGLAGAKVADLLSIKIQQNRLGLY